MTPRQSGAAARRVSLVLGAGAEMGFYLCSGPDRTVRREMAEQQAHVGEEIFVLWEHGAVKCGC